MHWGWLILVCAVLVLVLGAIEQGALWLLERLIDAEKHSPYRKHIRAITLILIFALLLGIGLMMYRNHERVLGGLEALLGY